MTAENIAMIVKCGSFALDVVIVVGLVCAIVLLVIVVAAFPRIGDDAWERELGEDER